MKSGTQKDSTEKVVGYSQEDLTPSFVSRDKNRIALYGVASAFDRGSTMMSGARTEHS